ncbi:MAG: hypothetical protein ACI8RZ_003718 [Myxococcota bacterium]|jgi:hypothetical protein
MLALLLGIASAATLQTASHHGVWTGAGVEWRSEIVLTGADAVTLALPLPANVAVLDGSEGSPIRDDEGRIIGFEFPTRRGRILLRQPLPTESRVTLTPPLVDSDRAQRVTLEGINFQPDPTLGMESRVLCATHPEISAEDRLQLDEEISGRRARLQEQPIYLIADDRLSSGLIGSIQDERRASVGFGLAAGGAFLGLLSLLALLYRGLERRAQVEAAEAYLKREFGN